MKSPDAERDAPEVESQTAAGRAMGVALVLGLCVLAIWWGSWLVFISIAALLFSIVMHEFGHMLAARWTGMSVTAFFVGFGPRLFSWRRGEAEYGMRLLPLGGYVRIDGMTSADKIDAASEHRTFRSKSYPRRAFVLSAGPAMNVLLALGAVLLLHFVVGWPSNSWEVAPAEGNTTLVAGPAYDAGIQPGDRLTAVNGVAAPTWDEFVDEIQKRPRERVVVDVERDGEQFSVPVQLLGNPDGTGYIGVRANFITETQVSSGFTALGRTIGDFASAVWQTLSGLFGLFANVDDMVDAVVSAPGDSSANENLEARPVSIVGIVDISSSENLNTSVRLLVFALVNLFLAAFNLIPWPPLDGGHIAVATYERFRERGGRERYMVDPKKLAPLMWIGAIAILALGLGALYLDIANPLL